MFFFLIIIISLQCPFIDMPIEDGDTTVFNANLISNAMKLLVESITHRIGFLNEYQSILDPSDSDIRYILQTINFILFLVLISYIFFYLAL